MARTDAAPRAITASRALSVALVHGGGVLIDGQTLTLTGAGFGSVSSPAPTAIDLFDDYAGAADGATVPQGTAEGAKWVGTQNLQFQAGFEFDSAVTLGSRPFAALAKGPKAHLDSISDSTGTGPARRLDSFYSTHWVYLHESPYGNPPHPDELISFKFARYWTDLTGEETRVSWLFRNGGPTDGGTITGHDLDPFYDKGVWNTLEWNRVEYEVSDAVDNGDGTFNCLSRCWINGKLLTFNRSSSNFNDTAIPTTPVTGQAWNTRLIGSDPSSSANLSQTFRHSLAEVFERPDSARVELSNSATFDDLAQQRRFVQVVSSWSDSQITIPKVFLGDLDLDSPVYAFIIPVGGSTDSVIDYGQVN